MSTTVPPRTDDQPPVPVEPPRGQGRWVPWVVAAVALLLVAGAGAVWLLLRDGTGAVPDPTGDGRVVDVLTEGVVADGTTDDTQALQAVLDAAAPGDVVRLPPGRVVAHADVLTVSSPGITLAGGTLLATDEERSSLTVAADDVVLQDVTLTVEEPSRRFEAYEQQRLRIDGHSGAVLRDVTVDGSAAAGVYVGGGASDFLLERVHVTGTMADGIHMTQGAHDGRVVEPLVEDVGDDGVAVVSYAQDGEPCARIEVVSPVVRGTEARGVSVVGGEDVTYTDIEVSGTAAAGVYVSAEGSFDTAGVDGVVVRGGTVSDANTDEAIDHGSILVFNGTGERTVTDVVIADLTISGTRESASRQVGLLSDRADGITDVVLEDLTFEGGGPSTRVTSNEDSTTYRTQGWTVDGDRVADETVD